MWQWLRRLALAALTAAAATAALVYAIGPHAATAAAFERYKAAHRAGNGALVAKLTAPREIAFFDEQRRHALTSPRAVVEKLSYRQRLSILTIRAMALDGILPLGVLRDDDPQRVYAATRGIMQNVNSLEQMDVLFAVPTGNGSATAYMSLTKHPGAVFQKAALALSYGAAYGFERQDDGTWLVDPTPIHETSAKENEHWATRHEPTGNEFLVKSYFRADPVRAEALWRPLE